MPVALDPRPPRPLTSNEISKVLLAILSGVGGVDPSQVSSFREVVEASKQIADMETAGDLGRVILLVERETQGATWRTAFTATIGGFMKWCAKQDVATAVLWLEENLHRVFPQVAAN